MRSLLTVTIVVSLSANLIRGGEPIDEKRVAALIRDLDADAFRVREQAEEELRKLDRAAIPQLQKALAGGVSPEQAGRLNRVLAALDPDFPLRKRVRELLDLIQKRPAVSAGGERGGLEYEANLRAAVQEIATLGRPGVAMLKEEIAKVADPKKRRELTAITEYLRRLHEGTGR